jgi:hypothetical protein
VFLRLGSFGQNNIFTVPSWASQGGASSHAYKLGLSDMGGPPIFHSNTLSYTNSLLEPNPGQMKHGAKALFVPRAVVDDN